MREVGRWVGTASQRLRSRTARLVDATPLRRYLARNRPVLSVIVPVYNVEEYLAECLDSLLDQTLVSMEILVVDDGSTDGSMTIVADYAARDDRIVVLRQRNRGPGAARNTGIAAARARYLTFLDSDDTVPRTAYAQMVSTLDRTGSDFALGAVRRFRHGKRSVPAWTRNVHAVERLAVSIDEFPEAMQDVIACNRMFRRSFWNERVGSFQEGVAYEDHVPMVAAFLRARSFDVLSAFTYNWRIRENATSMGQQKHLSANLHDRLKAKREAWRLVSHEASEGVRAAWLGRVISTDLPVFVPAALLADDDYRHALQAAATDFLSLSGPDVLRHARADRKLMTALVAAGRWDEVDRLTEHIRLHGTLPETVVRDGRVIADLPFGADLGLPPEMYELSIHQAALVAVLSDVRWDPDRTLHLNGWAYVRGIDLTTTVPSVEAWLQRLDKDQVLPLRVEHRVRLEATHAANDPNHRYDQAGFDLTVPPARLPTSGRWQLRLRVQVAGVQREGAVHTLSRFGTFDRMPSSPSLADSDSVRIVPLLDDADGFVLQARTDRFRATALHARPDGRLSGTVAALQTLRSRPVSAVLVDRDCVVAAPVEVDDEGRFAFELRPPRDGGNFSLRIATEDGHRHRVVWPSDARTGTTVRAPGSPIVWSRTPRGLVQAVSAKPRCRVVEAELDGGQLRLEVAVEDLTADDLARAELSSTAATVLPTSVEPRPRGRWTVTFPLTTAAWPDAPLQPLPSGSYDLSLQRAADEIALVAGARLLARFPLERRTDAHAVTVNRSPRSTQLQVRLSAPLREDERGKVAQRRLAARYQEATFEPADQVFFQCYRGEVATDHQLAIHAELIRRGVPLDLLWGIADRSVPLPNGARGVLVGSWEWYEAIGRSRYLCTNIDFDRFFRRRDHQRFLQTFRGYPYKAMGVSLWRSEGYSDRLIASECERRNKAWTSIVVPAPFCTDIYRREYRYDGTVLVTGYPRDDVLVAPPDGLRDRVRRRLGLAPDATVVLYAPTWREADATSEWSARIFDELDLRGLVDGLGAGYTVLMRGHTYNLGDSDPAAYARTGVLDVTRYPEVNDLVLAADVAVLDYSALRFDWLLTGKPMVFFAPDLADYQARRRPLFDYGPTAPGPVVRTTDEVVAAVRGLGRVTQEYAVARQTANRRFNVLNDGGATGRLVTAFFDEVPDEPEDSRPVLRAGSPDPVRRG